MGAAAEPTGGRVMKIYVLFLLISAITACSCFPRRTRTKEAAPVQPDAGLIAGGLWSDANSRIPLRQVAVRMLASKGH